MWLSLHISQLGPKMDYASQQLQTSLAFIQVLQKSSPDPPQQERSDIQGTWIFKEQRAVRGLVGVNPKLPFEAINDEENGAATEGGE